MYCHFSVRLFSCVLISACVCSVNICLAIICLSTHHHLSLCLQAIVYISESGRFVYSLSMRVYRVCYQSFGQRRLVSIRKVLFQSQDNAVCNDGGEDHPFKWSIAAVKASITNKQGTCKHIPYTHGLYIIHPETSFTQKQVTAKHTAV